MPLPARARAAVVPAAPARLPRARLRGVQRPPSPTWLTSRASACPIARRSWRSFGQNGPGDGGSSWPRPRRIADAAARHLCLFEAVIASDRTRNQAGAVKLTAIREMVHGSAFDYLGDKRADLPLFRAAWVAILVHPSPRLLTRTQGSCRGGYALTEGGAPPSSVSRCTRASWPSNSL